MTAILLQLCLDCRKHLGIDNRGDRDGKPVFRGHIHGRDSAPGLEGASALRPEPWTQRFLTCFAKRGHADIGRIF
jgi:hypothetical protein